MAGYGMMGGGMMGGFWFPGAGLVLQLVTLVALALIVWWMLAGRGKSDPERIAKERYARGELTKDEYEELIEALKR